MSFGERSVARAGHRILHQGTPRRNGSHFSSRRSAMWVAPKSGVLSRRSRSWRLQQFCAAPNVLTDFYLLKRLCASCKKSEYVSVSRLRKVCELILSTGISSIFAQNRRKSSTISCSPNVRSDIPPLNFSFKRCDRRCNLTQGDIRRFLRL